MGARFYDGYLGRWLSADTIVPEPGDPQSLNRYSYVGNRPLNASDPSGHYSKDVHYHMTFSFTYWLALGTLTSEYELDVDQAGEMAESMARQVAGGNQGTDCVVCFDSSALPTGRIHWLTQEQARERMENTVSGLHGDPEDFGRALHGIQDAYAHRGQGYTYWPSVFGMHEHDMGTLSNGGAPDFFENSGQFGHSGTSIHTRDGFMFFSLQGDLPYSLDPDYYDYNDPRDQAMTEETIYWIRIYLQLYYMWLLDGEVTWEDLEWERDETY